MGNSQDFRTKRQRILVLITYFRRKEMLSTANEDTFVRASLSEKSYCIEEEIQQAVPIRVMPDEGVLQGRNDLVNSFTIQQLCFDHGSADVRPLYLVKMCSLRRAACKSLTSRELMRITHLSIHFFLRRFEKLTVG